METAACAAVWCATAGAGLLTCSRKPFDLAMLGDYFSNQRYYKLHQTICIAVVCHGCWWAASASVQQRADHKYLKMHVHSPTYTEHCDQLDLKQVLTCQNWQVFVLELGLSDLLDQGTGWLR